MPLRKPLVLINGNQFQLPAGDTLEAVALSVGADLVNNSAANLSICTPVCAGVGAGAGGFQPARANAIGTSRVIGLIAAPQIAANASGAVLQVGLLLATVANWNAVTGSSNGLTPGTVYWLADNQAGRITTTPPSESGRFCTKIGQAITQTLMFVFPDDPIGL